MAAFERLLYMCISCGFFIALSLDFLFVHKMACYGILVVAQWD